MADRKSEPAAGRRQLTAAQHQAIRRHLALIPVYIWLLYSWTHLIVRIPRLEPVRDFAHFYIQAVIAREGNAHALYDRDEQAAMIRRHVGVNANLRFPPVYGPQVSVFFRPFSRFSYLTALDLWLIVTLLIYGACCYAVWRICPHLHDRRWTTLLLLTASPGLHFALGFSQISAIGLACVTSAFFALRAGRPFVAGLAIGALAYKPPLGLAMAVVMIGAGEWWVVLGAIVAACGQLAVGALYWHPAILIQYVEALRRLPQVAAEMEPFTFHIHSWRSFFELLGLPLPVALAAYAAASLVTLLVALRCWRSRGPLVLRYSIVLLATILVDPHMYAYDLLLLTPAFLLLWNWSLEPEQDRPVAQVIPALAGSRFGQRSFSAVFQAFLYICYFSQVLGIFAVTLRVQLSVVAFALLGAVIAMLLSSNSRARIRWAAV